MDDNRSSTSLCFLSNYAFAHFKRNRPNIEFYLRSYAYAFVRYRLMQSGKLVVLVVLNSSSSNIQYVAFNESGFILTPSTHRTKILLQ